MMYDENWLEYDLELDEMSWDVWCFEWVGTTLSFEIY